MLIFANSNIQNMIQELIKRYIWLIDTVARTRDEGITYQQINDKWQKSPLSDGRPYPWRTFQNHRECVEDIFGIEIKCRKSENVYFIKDNDELKNAKGFQKWMLETISINNTIEEYHSLRSRILLEQVPSGQKYLHDILQAMQDNHKIMFYYRPYWWEKEEPINVFNFEPFALKMLKKRWYVLGKYEGGEMKIYSLDRFEDIDISEDTFSMPEDFDAEAFFKDFLGIIIDQQVKTENILLKVSAYQANYFRSLPLHDSQQETERNEHYSLFSYRLKPTFDFMQELLSHGSTVEVLQPLSLRKDIADKIRKMVKHYKTRKK